MKRATVWTALALALGLFGAPAALATEPLAIPLHDTPQALPAIALTDESGNALTLEHWRGKVVLLNVWATWCGPCRQEMPTLDRLQAALGSERFEVVALSIDRAGVGVVRGFFDEIGIENLRIYIDDTMNALHDLEIFGLPGTLLIGPDGQELGRLVGPAEWDRPEMIAFIEAVIGR